MKKVLLILWLGSPFLGFGQSYDPSFNQYLNDVRIACLNKDTLQLHALFGDSVFGMSCYGLEGMDYLKDDWETFKGNFSLMDQPEKSSFWDLFMRVSANGFYYHPVFKEYLVPACHFWGNLWPEMPGISNRTGEIFYKDTVTLWVGFQPEDIQETLFVPEKPQADTPYPYRFERLGENHYNCYEKDKLLGYVLASDLIYWNFYFSFEKIRDRWILIYYEKCD